MYKPSLRTILLGVLIVMCLVALLSWRAACTAADKAGNERDVATSVGKQLDKVAEQTPAIRDDQKAKQDEADKIEGADTPLPAGYGRDLERVRRGEEVTSR